MRSVTTTNQLGSLSFVTETLAFKAALDQSCPQSSSIVRSVQFDRMQVITGVAGFKQIVRLAARYFYSGQVPPPETTGKGGTTRKKVRFQASHIIVTCLFIEYQSRLVLESSHPCIATAADSTQTHTSTCCMTIGRSMIMMAPLTRQLICWFLFGDAVL